MPGATRRRSRSPIVIVSRSARERGGAVNMLDAATIELAKNPGTSVKRHAERITCTIPGNRGRAHDRLTGGSFDSADRRVSMRGGVIKPAGTPANRRERRSLLMQRITLPDEPRHRRRHEDEDEDDDRRNGSFRDTNKPVQRLIDPTFVPKARAFFDHDDRGADDKWRGRSVYDPRIDFGPRHNRHRSSNWEGFGDRRDTRDRRRDADRERGRDDRRRDFSSRLTSFRPAAGADGLWTHDKFMELEDDTDVRKGEMKIVVDNRKTSRHVDED